MKNRTLPIGRSESVKCLASFLFNVAFLLLVCAPSSAFAADLRLLFMGDNGHHVPSRRFSELAPALADRGIVLNYTDRMQDLNPETLAEYDGLVLYANIDQIEEDQAKAVLDFVASGKGFVPLHCASFCWRNNADIVALMGGQFLRHGGQIFSTEIASADHPITQGFGGFTSWDETYIHHLHNTANRTVLEYRAEGEQADGNEREPWTWVRDHGQGRVFYTAWGHDQRTFTQPGFQNLVERGIRWACKDDVTQVPDFVGPRRFETPDMSPLQTDVAEFEFVDVGPKIPNYTPSGQWGTQGKPKTTMQMPLSPEKSMKHFVHPENLDIQLYADERDFESKPIAMTWDEQGRLWICETLDYPNELGKNRDRIRICEDTDGDSIADKFTVFAEGLSIPTAIVIVRDGAVVQDGNETVYFKDSDGDDVSDSRKTLITGWGLGDTHGGVSNFRYGLDNWIWAMQGYNSSTPKFNGQVGQTFRQGFYRFKLSQTGPVEVTDVEFIRSSDNNTWGLGISEEGLIFGSTANSNPSMFMPIPNRYYERVRGWAPSTLHSIADTFKFKPITENVRQVDQFGGYTAGAGHALYTARAFPSQWWNQTAFVAGPTGHLVGSFLLRRDGANYTSSSPLNLLASDDEWTAPIMAEVGPDGAVWVLDWYNYIVQHNPTPQGFETGKGAAYESDLRDKRHGRIYRVVPGQADKLHAFGNLALATDTELVETLTHPSMRWRLHAQRLLIERDAGKKADIIQQLSQLVADKTLDDVGLNVGAIHALNTLKSLSAEDALMSVMPIALQHPSAGVRRNAIGVLPTDQSGLARLLENRQLFSDGDMQVQLQAVLTLADSPSSPEAGELVAELATRQTDPIMVEALTSAAATHSVPYLEAITKTDGAISPATLAITQRVAEHVARQNPDADSLQRIVASLPQSDAGLAITILDGLTRGLPTGFATAPSRGLDEAFGSSFTNSDAALKAKLLRLAARCGTDALDSKVAEVVDRLMVTLNDEDAVPQQRLSAASDLVGFQREDATTVRQILACVTPQTPPDFADQLLDIVKRSDSDAVGNLLLEALPSLSPGVKSSALSVALGKPEWATSILDAVDANEFDLDELSLEQKQSLRAFPDVALKTRAEQLLAKGGGLPDADREKVLQSLMFVTEKSGNVDAGRAVYKKVCAACHQHGEMGYKIGPNLTGMAVHPKAELLTHILDPSRNVEGNYRLYNVLTIDGLIISGMLAGESKTSITIIDSQAKEQSIPREDIDELIASRKSVMPEGFEKQINETELTNLLEFLTDKGKYLPIPLDSYATAISTKGLFSDGDNGPDRMVFADWSPKMFKDIPFVLTNPEGQSTPNIILLYGPNASLPRKMPRSVTMPCNTPVGAIHLLSGVGGWSFPYNSRKSLSMIVRLHYQDGTKEDHELLNGIHFADYIRRVDVPESEFAFDLGGQQIRYLSVTPERTDTIESIELVKGTDNSAPIVMAITIEQLSPAEKRGE
jgi:putative membrane-bound dehydrogenase-like protein